MLLPRRLKGEICFLCHFIVTLEGVLLHLKIFCFVFGFVSGLGKQFLFVCIGFFFFFFFFFPTYAHVSVIAQKIYSRVFSWGMGSPQVEKNLPVPPTDHQPCFLTRACPPLLSFVPQNFKNFTSFFSQFRLLFKKLKAASESSFLCLKHQNLL